MGINFSKVNFSYFRVRKKQKPNYILKDIDLSISEQDEFIAIVGHTGSGKSTIVQLMNALLQPTSGSLSIFGKEITNKTILKPIRKRVGLVFQFPEYQIFEETVLKDIAFGPKNFGIEDPEGKAREVAGIMGITDLLDRSPFTLSGGQLRKVAISGILASNPDILILDEPSVGLDPLTKSELMDLLKKLHDDYHKTIIIITHDMEVVSKYCQRVIVLKKGEKIFDGAMKDLFAHDDLYEDYHLNYPETVRILKAVNEHFHLHLDTNKHSLTEAYQEIVQAWGKKYEQ
ncbi:MAG: energy-coupling factor transporter ATPase [Acholeplasmataceae bacterium]|jgi:energy-coupling factor transport system ATP-binding protein|nr:energy-coupling factor transporter ATPase [Acholeplasmataceae bacterium]